MPERSEQAFQTTQWTQIVAAQGATPEARDALRHLCETYYTPVEFFIRRYRHLANVNQTDEARDLTHEFFAKLLEGGGLDRADRRRGRFRTYLLGAVKHFLADQRDRDTSLKRGGGKIIESLDCRPTNSHHNTDPREVIDPQAFPPDSCFDHQWALTVVEQAMTTLRAEAAAAGDAVKFAVMQSWLVTPANPSTAVTAAQSLRMTDGAFKVAVHRLRKRFKQLVIDQIAHTVDDPNDVQQELNYLIAALAS